MIHALRQFKLRSSSHWSLQFASGLYADLGWRAAWSALIPRAGQHIALLGNCCSVATRAQRAETEEFLRRTAAMWETVYLVPGPRELAAGKEGGPPFYEQLHELRAVAKGVSAEWENIYIMDQGEVAIRNKDITVLGATGWTTDGNAVAGGEPIWKGVGQGITKEDIATWHGEDMAWLRERNAWWGIHHPDVRKVILTHDLCTDSLLGAVSSNRKCMPITSVAPILGHLSPRAPYAWLCGAGGSAVSGMSRHTFLATNGLRAEEGGAMNRFYLPNRCLEIPLRRGPPPSAGSAPAPALVLA
jgi:hypothetical protein